VLRRLTVKNLAIVEDLAGETVPETAVHHARELLAQAGNR